MNTHSYFEPLLRKELKPLYKDLMEAVKPYNHDICPFAMQWGEEFPKENNQGILFVGRATNGWVSESDNVEDLFGTTDEAIFDRVDQMKWVERNDNPYYNSNKSAFWRVIRGVSAVYYTQHELNHVAWSNVAKVAPPEGNPDDTLYYLQLECSNKILSTEIKILSPKAVVFLTGEGWAKDAIEYLGNGIYPEPVAEKEWGGGFTAKLYRLDKLGIILTEHPQTKEETTHVDAIKALIDLI